jgi:PAS domain S-box-containing protein
MTARFGFECRKNARSQTAPAVVLSSPTVSEREQLFQTVFEDSPDAIFIEDLDGNVLAANPAACRLHGLTEDQLVGMNASALVPPEWRDSVAHPGQLVDGHIEGFSLGAGGCRIPVSIRTSEITYMGRAALLLQVRDMTEQRRSESQYRLLFALNPQPMWVHDMETRRFIAVNQAALRLYRYEREEFLAMESIDAVLAGPRGQDSDLPMLSKVVEVTTARHRRKDGGYLTVELTQHTMELDGRLVAFVMITRVISSR